MKKIHKTIIRSTLTIASLIWILTPASCGLHNLIDSYGLAEDVKSLMKKCDMKPENLDCNMVNDTRIGYCECKLSEEDIRKLTKGIDLKELPTFDHLNKDQNRRVLGSINMHLGSGLRLTKLEREYLTDKDIRFLYAYKKDEYHLLGGRFYGIKMFYNPLTKEASVQADY